jgi:hypothetical protein
MQATDLFSRTPLKEHVMFTIIGFVFLTYSLVGSHFPTDFWRDPTTTRQRRVNRVFYIVLGGFHPSLALSLAGLVYHFDEHFSGLRRVAHFPQERDPSSLHAILGF